MAEADDERRARCQIREERNKSGGKTRHGDNSPTSIVKSRSEYRWLASGRGNGVEKGLRMSSSMKENTTVARECNSSGIFWRAAMGNGGMMNGAFGDACGSLTFSGKDSHAYLGDYFIVEWLQDLALTGFFVFGISMFVADGCWNCLQYDRRGFTIF